MCGYADVLAALQDMLITKLKFSQKLIDARVIHLWCRTESNEVYEYIDITSYLLFLGVRV